MSGSIRASRSQAAHDDRCQPAPPGLGPADASQPGASLAGVPGRSLRAVARRSPDRPTARHRSQHDRPLPPPGRPVGRALAGHRRSRPRPLPAPARRRPRVAAGRPVGRAAVGGPGGDCRRSGGAFWGAMVGVLAGYLGGRLDSVLMRPTDGVIALPLLPLLIVLAAIDPRKIGIPADTSQSETFSLYRIVVIVALTGWTTVARLVRAETLSLKARDFTRAAQALGAVPLRIMFRHILPNAAGSLVVATTMSVGTLILFESTLSFLGLGTQPPAASWGNMLTGAQELLQQAPVLALWPGLLIFLTVIAFNFVGDGLQDALDPRSERRA